MAVLEGCVQPGLAPQINAAAARVLDRLGISLVAARDVGCCGAMEHHLGRSRRGAGPGASQRRGRASACWTQDAEAIVSTASGCGMFAKDYGHVLRHESAHRRAAGRAGRRRDTRPLRGDRSGGARSRGRHAARRTRASRVRVAWQAPCSLQHGQRVDDGGQGRGTAACRRLRARRRTREPDAVLRFGRHVLDPAAGTRRASCARASSTRCSATQPTVIATANIGCLEHLRQASPVPVRHWIEIVDALLFA